MVQNGFLPFSLYSGLASPLFSFSTLHIKRVNWSGALPFFFSVFSSMEVRPLRLPLFFLFFTVSQRTTKATTALVSFLFFSSFRLVPLFLPSFFYLRSRNAGSRAIPFPRRRASFPLFPFFSPKQKEKVRMSFFPLMNKVSSFFFLSGFAGSEKKTAVPPFLSFPVF